MDITEVEVKFDEWCDKCKYCKTKEYEEPCNSCLDYGFNSESTKPVNFKEDK
jgi:recombinational DNA repair protein RecR